MDRPGGTVLVIRELVAAGPASECQSVMRRKLFNLAAAASLVLSLAVVALWVRGFSMPEGVEHNRRWIENGQLLWQVISFHSSERSLFFGVLFQHRAANNADRGWEWRLFGYHRPLKRPSEDSFWQRRFGVSWAHYPSGSVFIVAVPHLLLAVALLALPIVVARREWRRRLAVKRGLCPACGYDLRATPDRCPECGAILGETPPHNPPMQRTATASSGAVE